LIWQSQISDVHLRLILALELNRMSLPTPYGGQNRVRLSRKEYLTWGGITIGIVAAIVLFAFELPHFNNTFRLGRMFLCSTIVAVVTGTFIILKIKQTFKDTVDAIRVSLMMYLGLIALTFLIAHVLNRNITHGQTRTETYPFLEHRLYRISDSELAKENTFLTFIEVDNDMKRIVSRGPIYNETSKNQNVTIPVKTGLFGFKVAKIY